MKRQMEPSAATLARSSGVALARWCSRSEDGTFSWDAEKLVCLLDETELHDVLYMQNILHGAIITGRLYPLLLDEACDEMSTVRSLPYLFRMVETPACYSELSASQQLQVMVACRDLFFADSMGLLSEKEVALLRSLAQLHDGNEVFGELREGVTFSCCPTNRHKMLRYTTAVRELLDEANLAYFAMPRLMDGGIGAEAAGVYAVFIDPHELAYHSFEGILPLDRILASPLSFSLAGVRRVQSGADVVAATLEGTTEALQSIAASDLYLKPLNSAARGGSRFIFHSAALGQALTEAVRHALSAQPTLFGASIDASRFVAVNPVFRCNRFEPHDAPFSSHRDTPYFDRTRGHLSTHTLLLYLRGGRGTPVLRLEGGPELHEVEPLTCVIFPQCLQHEGCPFVCGTKEFLRTELLVQLRSSELEHHPVISSLFTQATYFTGESIFHEELAKAAEERYECVNALHWSQGVHLPTPVGVVKQLHTSDGMVSFLSNGHDYFFPQRTDDGGGVPSHSPSLKQCAVLAILDHFNCKLPIVGAFRSALQSTVVHDNSERKPCMDAEWAWSALERTASQSKPKQSETSPVELEQIDAAEKRKRMNRLCRPLEPLPNREERHCCPFHCGIDEDGEMVAFNAHACPDVRKEFAASRSFTMRKLLASPLLFLGRKILIDERHVIIHDDKIYVVEAGGADHRGAVNFASCWNCEPLVPPHFIEVVFGVPSPRLLLPPMPFVQSKRGVHLIMDFFRNDWLVQVDVQRELPIPGIKLSFEVQRLMIQMYGQEDAPPCLFRRAYAPDYDCSSYRFGSKQTFLCTADGIAHPPDEDEEEDVHLSSDGSEDL